MCHYLYKVVFILLGILSSSTFVLAGNIDVTDRLAHGFKNDLGYINFRASSTVASSSLSVTVSDNELAGYAWGEKIGWINLHSASTTSWGVHNNSGILSGYAWNQNIGWIN